MAQDGRIVAYRTSALLVVLMMLAASLLGMLAVVPEPAEALTKDVDTTEDLEGSGSNTAVLDKVVIEDGTIRLDTETYQIHDTAWSDGNVDGMTVDNENKPKLALASHWSTSAGFNGDGSYQHSAVWDRDNSEVLLYGGRHDAGGRSFIHNTLWSYDPSSESWREVSSVDRFRFLHQAVWAESEHMMIIWGGLTLIESTLYLMDETLCYWPGNNSWGLRAPSPFGGRVGHAMVWDDVNNQMLVAGGTPDGNFSNSTNEAFAFRPRTNSWVRLQSFASDQARGGAAAVWDTQTDKMIMYGGRRRGNAMTSVLSYDPSSNTWTQRGNGPADRWFHSMSWDPVNNKAYSFGGLNSNNQMSARLYEYTTLSDTWRQLEMAPDARFWTSFIWDPINSRGYNFAGAASVGNPIVSYNDVMQYQIEVPFVEQGWLTSAIFDVGGVLSVGKLSWTPTSQGSSVGPGAVKFQVGSSSSLEIPSVFVGPDGTSDTYFTDPAGTTVGDHHFGAGRLAYRMFFHTDDTSISPTVDSVSLEAIRYYAKGTYTSPIIDLGQETSSLERVTYRSQLPTGSNPNLVKVTVRIRTSMSATMAGASAWETVEKDDTMFTIPYGRFFQFEVTINTDTQARHLTPVFKGITVEYNSPPVVTFGLLDRPSGDRETLFTWTITYTDVDNNEPTVHNVYIDDVAYEMSSPDVDFTDGALYTFSMHLGLGGHTYWFEFSDGKNSVRDPPGGEYSGPEVLNRAPVPVIDYPASGERYTPDEPIEFSASKSKDPDGDKLTYRWLSSIDGLLDTHSAFVARLSEGIHVVTLEVLDEFGEKNSTDISLQVKPYLPFLEVRDVYFDKSDPIEKDRVTVTAIVYNMGEARASPAIVEFLVDQEVVDEVQESLDIGDKLTLTFHWTASGERVFLGVRTRPGAGADVDDELFRSLNVTANSPPVINFDVSSPVVVKGKAVTFINNGTKDPNGDQLTYQWEFGDGTTSNEATTTHEYTTVGTFYANLTVTDKRGGSSEETFVITVKKKPSEDGPGFAATIALLAVAGAGGVAATRRRRR